MNIKILYHGSSEIVTEPVIRAAKFYKNFGWGFYCTDIKKQAYKGAIRRSSEKGVVNIYHYVENSDLKILKFDGLTDEWLDFIASCRSGNQHDYDIEVYCKENPPRALSIGKLYSRLILSLLEDEEDLISKTIEVLNSWLVDEITNFNSSLYYSVLGYLKECYLQGEILDY